MVFHRLVVVGHHRHGFAPDQRNPPGVGLPRQLPDRPGVLWTRPPHLDRLVHTRFTLCSRRVVNRRRMAETGGSTGSREKPMSWQEEVDELRRREAMARAMGGEEGIARQKRQGKL